MGPPKNSQPRDLKMAANPSPAREIVHTGFVIENLLDVFNALNEKAKELSPKKTLDIRNLFAVSHISSSDSKTVSKIAESLPEETVGQIVSYCAVKPHDNQGAFIGICIKCIGKEFYTVLYDNGKNSLYKCRTIMERNKTKIFVKIDPPVEVKLRRYVMYQ